MGRYHCWPKALESQSPKSPTAFSRSVGESEPRIPNRVFPKRWRVEVPNLQQRFPQALESRSPESPTAFSRSVGESKCRISKLSYEKLAQFVGRYHCWPKALESQSPESPTAFSRNVGESKPRISNSVFPKRWRVEVPNLKAKLRKVSKIRGKISLLAQSVGESKPQISNCVFPKRWRVRAPNPQQSFPKALESQSPESPRAFSRSVGESKCRISKLIYEKLAEFLGRYHCWPKAFSDSAFDVLQLARLRFPFRPFVFPISTFCVFRLAGSFSDSLARFPTRVFRLGRCPG